MEGRVVAHGNRGNVFEGIVERARKITPGGDATMHVHDKVAESHLVQSFRDGFDGSALLGDEEDALALGDEGRDEVGDSLGLSCARRTLDDERFAAKHTINRHVLAGVGVKDEELVRWWSRCRAGLGSGSQIWEARASRASLSPAIAATMSLAANNSPFCSRSVTSGIVE